MVRRNECAYVVDLTVVPVGGGGGVVPLSSSLNLFEPQIHE